MIIFVKYPSKRWCSRRWFTRELNRFSFSKSDCLRKFFFLLRLVCWCFVFIKRDATNVKKKARKHKASAEISDTSTRHWVSHYRLEAANFSNLGFPYTHDVELNCEKGEREEKDFARLSTIQSANKLRQTTCIMKPSIDTKASSSSNRLRCSFKRKVNKIPLKISSKSLLVPLRASPDHSNWSC